ncbi:MAG: HTTM domain-containing protein [Pirellulales bacterium]
MHPFAIDYRSLSLFRICLGAVIVYYLFTHLGVFDAFHSADKAISSETLQVYYGRAWKWSLNWLSDSSYYQYTLLIAGFTAASCLILGLHTRLATIASWLLVASFNNNAPYVASGGDALLNVLLFWSMFLPLGQRWSLDALQRPPAPSDKIAPPTLISVATAGILLQMAMMYFFTGISKWNVCWFDGTALDIALSNEAIVRPAGKLMREFPWLTHAFTHITLYAELLFPLVMFSPWKTTACRSVALLTFLGFHIGIELTMTVLIFSCISITGLMLFVPSKWWDLAPLRSLQAVFDRLHSLAKSPKSESRQLKRQHKRTAKRQSDDLWTKTHRLRQGLAIAVILYTIAYNLVHSFASEKTIHKIASAQQPAMLLVLNQQWNMFAYPPALCIDVACVGHSRNGKHVDILRNGAEVTDPTQPPAQPVPDISTRMFNGLVLLSHPRHKAFREGFLKYLCQQWNDEVLSDDQELIECHLTYYPRTHHPLAGKVTSQNLFHLDLQAQGSLLAGERHGPWVLFHQNGQKMAAGNYQLGKSVGYWTFWNTDGTKAAEGMMAQGKPAGEWKHYQGDEVKVVNHSEKQTDH